MGANQRYLQALAAAPLKGEGVAALDALCRPRTRRGRTVRPLQSPQPRRPGPLPSRPGRPAHHQRLPQRRPGRPPLPPSRPRPRRSPPTMRTSLPAHRQTPRPRTGRQGPTSPPLPRHPLRPPSHDRRTRHPRPPIPRPLPRARGLKVRPVSRDTQILPGSVRTPGRWLAPRTGRGLLVGRALAGAPSARVAGFLLSNESSYVSAPAAWPAAG